MTMKMKYKFLPVIAALFAFTATSIQAQDIKIGLVDMQEALNKYKKTQVRTDEINARSIVLQEKGKERGESLKALETKIKAETEIIQNAEFSTAKRETAGKAREGLLKEFGTQRDEALKAGQKAAEELAKARKDMEIELVAEITKVMEDTSRSQGVDLVFDKSFLPRANKAIIFTSDKVLDMTQEIITKLNSQ